MSRSAGASARADTTKLGRFLYETRLPGLDRRVVWKLTWRALVITLVTIVIAVVLLYVFQSAAVALTIPVPAILANVRDAQVRRFSIALLLVIYGTALLVVGAVFPTFIAPLLGLDPEGYPGLALLFFLVSGVPGALMALIGGAQLIAQYRRSSLHLALYERGLMLDQLWSHGVYTWDAIAAASREQRGQESVYVIRPRRGRSFVLTERFRDGRHIGEVLLKVYANSKLPG
jgi:hypothetical protein